MTAVGKKNSSAPAVKVTINEIGIRGLFAATALPKGFIIPFDGINQKKNTLPTKNTANKPLIPILFFLTCTAGALLSFLPNAVIFALYCKNPVQLPSASCLSLYATSFSTPTREIGNVFLDPGHIRPWKLLIPWNIS